MDVPHVEPVNNAFGVCVVVGGGVIYPGSNPRAVTCLLHALSLIERKMAAGEGSCRRDSRRRISVIT